MSDKILKRLTLASINGIRGGFKNVKERFRAGTFYGVAHGAEFKPGENMADSWKFTGEFKAINKDGEPCVGSVCYIPSPLQDMLATAVNDADGPVEFAVEFDVVPDETSVLGYVIEGRSLIDQRPSKALEALESGVLSKHLQLGHDGGNASEGGKGKAKVGK